MLPCERLLSLWGHKLCLRVLATDFGSTAHAFPREQLLQRTSRTTISYRDNRIWGTSIVHKRHSSGKHVNVHICSEHRHGGGHLFYFCTNQISSLAKCRRTIPCAEHMDIERLWQVHEMALQDYRWAKTPRATPRLW